MAFVRRVTNIVFPLTLLTVCLYERRVIVPHQKKKNEPRQQSPRSVTFCCAEWRSNPSTFPRPRARPSQDPWRPSAAGFLWPSRRGTRTSTRRTTTPATSPGAPSSATFSRRRLSRVSNEISSRAPDLDVDRVGRAAPSRPGFGALQTSRARNTMRARPASANPERHTRVMRPEPEKGFGRPSSLTTPPERFF